MINEDLIEGLSFPVYHRVSTSIVGTTLSGVVACDDND